MNTSSQYETNGGKPRGSPPTGNGKLHLGMQSDSSVQFRVTSPMERKRPLNATGGMHKIEDHNCLPTDISSNDVTIKGKYEHLEIRPSLFPKRVRIERNSEYQSNRSRSWVDGEQQRFSDCSSCRSQDDLQSAQQSIQYYSKHSDRKAGSNTANQNSSNHHVQHRAIEEVHSVCKEFFRPTDEQIISSSSSSLDTKSYDRNQKWQQFTRSPLPPRWNNTAFPSNASWGSPQSSPFLQASSPRGQSSLSSQQEVQPEQQTQKRKPRSNRIATLYNPGDGSIRNIMQTSEGSQYAVEVSYERRRTNADLQSRRMFDCHLCNKSFTHKGSLSTHIRIHTGTKPHICPFCSKRFTQSGNLATHIRTHTKERPFRCKICNKSFSHKSNLNSHNQVHTGDKPFKCLQCGKGFTRKSRILSHLAIHTRDNIGSMK
mmetsp:Transcript_13148/g.32249  ORF Transcript_13148/g.32249 Transcript_13148/m.32249 type:complete len:428 (-) Transcript_13148:298-1581(-)